MIAFSMMKRLPLSVFSTLAGPLLALALVPAAVARKAVVPPPPFLAPDALPATPTAQSTAQAVTGSASVAPPSGEGNVVPAPSISDDQQIANSMDMAMALFHAEDYQGTIRATTAILRRYPKKRLYWVEYLRGLSNEHLERYRQALKSYRKVLKQAPNTTYANAAVFRIGLCQLKDGDAEEAMYTLRDIIENNPHSQYRLEAYVHLGNLYRQTKNWRQAEHIYSEIIRYYPNTSWSWMAAFYLAETRAHEGDVDGAMIVYRRMANDPVIPDTMRAQAEMRMGDLYIQDQKWLEAIQVYQDCLRDYNKVPGVQETCTDQIQIATQGRRYHRVPYRDVNVGVRAVSEGPADQGYLLEQERSPGQ